MVTSARDVENRSVSRQMLPEATASLVRVIELDPPVRERPESRRGWHAIKTGFVVEKSEMIIRSFQSWIDDGGHLYPRQEQVPIVNLGSDTAIGTLGQSYFISLDGVPLRYRQEPIRQQETRSPDSPLVIV
ncbi:MAG: hypothetical protein WAR37_04540 [Candidatus Microsaccharimonas sp.]